MTSISDVLDRYRRQPSPFEASTSNPFKLASTLAAPATPRDVAEVWGGSDLPGDAVELWAACREGHLFEDVDYGQWGLILLAPAVSAARTAKEREERPLEFGADDIVIGEFLGDQEILVLAPSEAGERRVLIALPLDSRHNWFGAANNLGEFFERYFDNVGEKYWERQDVAGG